MDIREKLAEKIKTLPQNPGVYIMYDKDGHVLYVGKAKVLKNRVKQYFYLTSNKTEKVSLMMSHVDDFRYIITKSETDALSLENNLIKKYNPPYNILLKDDKQYPYLRLTVGEDFPRVEITRKVRKDNARYFGPVMGGVKDYLELVRDIFPIASCKYDFSRLPKNFRPCLNYHIGRCGAPCAGYITKEEYAGIVKKLVEFLGGDDKYVVDMLKKKMADASEKTEYEKALLAKNQLDLVLRLRETKVVNLTRIVDYDVFNLCSDGKTTVATYIGIRKGKILVCENYPVIDVSITEAQAMSAFLTQYYSANRAECGKVLVGVMPENKEALEEFLSAAAGKKVSIVCPQKGDGRQLTDMALKNASDYLEKNRLHEDRKYASTVGAAYQLQELLGLKKFPRRMECYDISNVQGVDKVASMVVFVNGEKQNKLYRRFKIKTVEGANDFASMAEVIKRRLDKIGDEQFGEKPDLIVIDGGLGQLGYAGRVLAESGQDIEMISLAKREEEVFTTESKRSVMLPRRSHALNLLINIRDEAHRFAITYFRRLHTINALKSELEKIDGIGEKRQKQLMKAFRNIENIENADVGQLIEVGGLNKKTAQNVYDYFHA